MRGRRQSGALPTAVIARATARLSHGEDLTDVAFALGVKAKTLRAELVRHDLMPEPEIERPRRAAVTVDILLEPDHVRAAKVLAFDRQLYLRTVLAQLLRAALAGGPVRAAALLDRTGRAA